ncbi:MAG: hypothetical protein GC171_07065 [Terrimonas sp.]|nr:hypothetical protein [Terrimonas sp.]
MKRIVITCFWIWPFFMFAQQNAKKLSLYVQGGYKSSAYFNKSGNHEFVSETEISHHKCIILNAGLQWQVAEKWRIGPSFTYDHFGTKQRSVEFSNMSFLLRGDRIWKATKDYEVYSGLAMGIRKLRKFEEEIETTQTVNFSYQLYLAGINLKLLSNFFIDVNIGWGNTGIFSAGARILF